MTRGRVAVVVVWGLLIIGFAMVFLHVAWGLDPALVPASEDHFIESQCF
jgi:hypothetical protein